MVDEMAVAQGPSSPPAVMLFDLGGVLLESVGFERLNELLPQAVDSQALKERWLTSPAAREFECGRLAAPAFMARLVAEWGLSCTAAQLLTEYAGWVKGFYPGTLDLLAALRPRYRLACLSNSNSVHWDKFDGFAAHFEVALASHRLGVLKPDAECFRRALKECGVGAGEVAFFDDAALNVRAARALGLRAFQVDGPEGVRRVLRAQGWME